MKYGVLFMSLLCVSTTTFSFAQNKKVKTKEMDGGIYGPPVSTKEFPVCNHDAWVLAFEDNFDGNELNRKNWKLPYQGILAGFDFANGGSKQWYANTGSTPALPIQSNIVVENGILKLVAQKEETPIQGIYVTDWSTEPPKRDTSYFDYSSAWLESQQLFGYGKYEARVKLPKGKGMWPAFWLFKGENGLNFEIDIFEFWNEKTCFGGYSEYRLSKNPHLNIHSNKIQFPRDITAPTDFYKPCQSWPEMGYDEDFHVFALEWDYYKIVWYIDGEKVRTAYHFLTKKGKPVDCSTKVKKHEELWEAYFWPDTETMDVRFNLGVEYGKNNEPDANTTFPQAFEIDYFRYYQQIDFSKRKPIR